MFPRIKVPWLAVVALLQVCLFVLFWRRLETLPAPACDPSRMEGGTNRNIFPNESQSLGGISFDQHEEIIAELLSKFERVSNLAKQLVQRFKSKHDSSKAISSSFSASGDALDAMDMYFKKTVSEERVVLKVATYNIWNINPPYDERLGRIVEYIRSLQPDIIGLQEIRMYKVGDYFAVWFNCFFVLTGICWFDCDISACTKF